MPTFGVYIGMGTENFANGTETFANGTVVYTSQEDEPKTCVDRLKDDAHYRFDCRCGCGGGFAGYGLDIKASGKIGRIMSPEDKVNVTTGDGGLKLSPTMDGETLAEVLTAGMTTPGTDLHISSGLQTDGEIAEIEELTENYVEKVRPFVSDRYIKKALYGLSDDEIDSYHENHPDPLQESGYDLSGRQPPGIGAVVYSLATDEGPFTVIDYLQKSIPVDGETLLKVHHGIVRNAHGKLISVPLADLALHYPDRPKKPKPKGSWLWPVFAIATSSLIGSAVAVAYYVL